jgi:hypothetical protein
MRFEGAAMLKLKRATKAVAAASLLAAVMALAWPALTFADKQLSEEEYTAAMNRMLRHRDRHLLVLRWVEPVNPQRQQVKYELRHRDRHPLVLRWVESVKPQRQHMKHDPDSLSRLLMWVEPVMPAPVESREVTYDHSSVPGVIIERRR